MAYANDERVVVERRSSTGRILAAIVGVVLLVALILFATGFWSAKVEKTGSLPDVDISAKGGSLPKVDLDSKKVVVGAKDTAIDVPKVTTEKEKVSVPVVGVTDGKKD
jgi:hypothetical protein